LDSAPGILHTLDEIFQKMGVDTANLDLTRYLGPPLRKTFGEHFADEAQIEYATELYRASYKVKGSHECVPYEGAKEMLQRLHNAGILLATATSKPTVVVEPILQEQGLAPLFDLIAGASMDNSRDTKTDVIRYVLEQPMMQGKRILMVGDRQDDLCGAADCGLDAAAALYGYGSREEAEPFCPKIYVNRCAELADFLLEETTAQ
jgi:phosphoglycolate phosphatase